MTIVFLAGQGANHRALACKLHVLAPITAVAVISRPASTKVSARRTLARIASLSIGRPLRTAWTSMLNSYARRYPDWPATDLSTHDDVNADGVRSIILRTRPTLVVVSGTNIIKQRLIDAVSECSGRILNLHTGISPYIKGGPNCTNWCLAIRRFDLIGSTVMWLDAGIDSGALVATERAPLAGTESLERLHVSVMEHAQDLYLRCVERFLSGAQLPEIRQAEIGHGTLFLNKDWTATQIIEAVKNFYLYYRPHALEQRDDTKLVSI